MAGLYWMTVALTVFLSAGKSLAVIDQNELARVVNDITNRFTPSYTKRDHTQKYPMFSVAARIPFNTKTNRYDVSQVPDGGQQVRYEIQNCNVYTSTSVVAATVLRWPDVLDQCPNAPVTWNDVLTACRKTSMKWEEVQTLCPSAVQNNKADHAEYRTVTSFTNLQPHDQEELLLFYVYASPCSMCARTTGRRSIVEALQHIRSWKNYAFVFSKVFRPRSDIPIDEETLQQALVNLGTAIGLENIYRCDRVGRQRQCISCSTNGQLTRNCYIDDQTFTEILQTYASDMMSFITATVKPVLEWLPVGLF